MHKHLKILFFFKASLVIPVIGEAKALRAEKLLATIEEKAAYKNDFVRLSNELKGKNVDEAIEILSKEKNIDEITTIANKLIGSNIENKNGITTSIWFYSGGLRKAFEKKGYLEEFTENINSIKKILDNI